MVGGWWVVWMGWRDATAWQCVCRCVRAGKAKTCAIVCVIVNAVPVVGWRSALASAAAGCPETHVTSRHAATPARAQGKAAAKAQLQAELGLEVDPSVPLFGYIGRLEEQKGALGGGATPG